MMLCIILALGQAEVAAAPDTVVIGQRDRRGEQASVSTTELDPTDLRDRRIESLSDLAATVPNLSALPAGVMATEQFTIRGLYSPVGSPTVALFLDDVPLAVRASAFVGPSDIEALDLAGIDVLRGAQGTASGASAMAGIVRLRANRPRFDRADAGSAFELTDVAHGGTGYRASVAAGAPLAGDRLAFRVAASARREGGYIDRIGEPADRDVDTVSTRAARASLALRAGGLLIEPSLFVQRRNVSDLPLFEEGFGRFAQHFVRPQRGTDRVLATQLTVRLPLGRAELTATSALLDRRSRQGVDYSTVFGELVLGGDLPGLQVPGGTLSLIDARQRTWSHELRLANDPDAALAWTLGAYWSRATLDIGQRVEEPGIADLARTLLGVDIADLFGTPLIDGRLSYRSDERDREREAALFGDLRWRPTPRLELAGGLRLVDSRFTLETRDLGPYAGTGEPRPDRSSTTDRRALPRIAATWRARGIGQLTLAATRGFRPGGGNTPVPALACADDLAALGRSRAPAGYGADDTRTLELGYRGQIAQKGALRATLFHTDWRDVAQQIDLPGCGFAYVDNLGRARVRGMEAEASIALRPGLTVQAALGYADARFTRTVSVGPAEASAVLVSRGDRLPYVPRVTYMAGAEWRRPLPGVGAVAVSGVYRFAGAFRRTPGPGAAGHLARTYAGPAIRRLDLSARIVGRRAELGLFVENVLDAHPLVYESVDLVPVTQSPVRAASIRPRTVGLRLVLRPQGAL